MLDLQGGKTSARFTEDGTCPTITRGKGSASDVHSVVETINSNDVDVSPTLLSTDYKGEDADELRRVLDSFAEHIAEKYHVTWAEKPETIKEDE